MSSKDGKRKRPLVPQLRFTEFLEAGEWEDVSLSNITKTITPNKKLQTSQYMLNGSYPIIDQSQLPVAGWTDDVESVITRPLPLIIFGDHTCVLKLATQPFAQGADGIKIISVASSMITEYIFQYLLACPIVMKEYKRHFSDLIKRKVYYPKDFKEQQKIADCLSSLDERITLEAQKLEALKRHKKGLMQQLFPREGETIPRLRFPEFREALSVLPLVNVANFVSDKISINQITVGNYVSTENLLPDFGGLNPSEKLPSVSFVTSFYPNDILVSNIRPYLKKVVQAKIAGGASNDVIVLRAKKNMNPDYLSSILRSDFFIDYVMRGAKGVKMPRGEVSMIKQFPVPCFSFAEQQKIADCLSSLDERITLEVQKLEALKRHKKGLMQQLFPVLDDGD